MTRKATDEKLNFRAAPVEMRADGAPATLDEKTRSVLVTAATENPVQVFDYSRMEIVDEVLLMAGAEIPKSRQVVLLDSHSRFDSSSVIGSLREIAASGGELKGRAVFASDAEAVFRKVAEGHLTDFSIGYRVIDSKWIPAGETLEIKGRKYAGPVKVATRWKVKELSAVPIGADEMAKARSDAEPITEPKPAGEPARKDATIMEIEEVRKQERERLENIDVMCRQFGIADEMRTGWINSGATVDSIRAAVLEIVAGRLPQGIGYRGPVDDYHPATVTADATDKRVDAQVDGMLLRAGVISERDEKKKPAGGAREYANFSLLDHARECLKANGRRANGTPDAVIREALSTRGLTTGDLPFVLGNFSSKSAMIGFEEAKSGILATAKEIPAKDFKTQYLVKLSEADDLEDVPEHGDYQYGSREESHESYALSTYGKIFAVTRQALVNDDLGLLANIPRSHGQAAARKVRDVVLAVYTGNATMADGEALFSAAHTNFVGSGQGNIPGDATLQAAFLAMKKQTGPNGAILGITPKYLICPVELEISAFQLLNSTGDLTDNKSAGVRNAWYQRLELIPEPALTSSVNWYLACDPQRFDGLVISYLNGQAAPTLAQRDGWTVDGVEFKVTLDVAAAPADYRGLYMNYGS